LEPIGTITKFYPFLSKETVETIEDLIVEAEDYRDFVHNLIQSIEQESMTTEISQFAVLQTDVAFRLDDDIWSLIRSRCDEDVITRPWSFFNDPEFSFLRELEKFEKTVQESLNSGPSNWIRLHLHLIGGFMGTWVDYKKHIDSAHELISTEPELECFSPHLCYIEQYVKRREGDIDGILKGYQNGLEIAERNDDVYWKAILLQGKAMALQESNPHEALELLNEALELSKSICTIVHSQKIISDMGHIHSILGEYDLALAFYLEGVELASGVVRKGVSVIDTTASVAGIYCDLDQPLDALEWIKWYKGLKAWGRIKSIETRVLIQLDQLDEVPDLLEKYHSLVLERGIDVEYAYYNYIKGLYEFALRDTENASQSIEQALSEFERLSYARSVNRALLALTQIEVVSERDSKATQDVDSSGPWMNRLETHAREKNYPGIRMQHALLKAEYQELIGEYEASRLTLQDALTFTDSPGVKTLRKRINERLEELEGILQ
jgi:tetratricopeptide (TPR) repeat protein